MVALCTPPNTRAQIKDPEEVTYKMYGCNILAARISPETTDATTIPHNPQPLQYHNRLSRYNSQNERSYRIFGSSREVGTLI